MHIFYCDDDLDNIDFLAEVLQRIDPTIRLTAHQDPTRCVEILEILHPKPDYIFLDFAMTKMDGLQFASSLSTNLREIPLVIISGAFDGELMQKVERFGVYGTIRKSNLGDLEKSVRQILKVS